MKKMKTQMKKTKMMKTTMTMMKKMKMKIKRMKMHKLPNTKLKIRNTVWGSRSGVIIINVILFYFICETFGAFCYFLLNFEPCLPLFVIL